MKKDEIEKDRLIKRWTEYTEELYMNDPEMEREFVEMPYQDEPTVIRCEMEKALKDTAGRKAIGVDDLPIELLKEAGEEAIDVLTALCQKIWETKVWPQEWQRSIFLTLPKKGDLKLFTNYRTIALISHISKVLLRIIQNRITTYIDRELPFEQADFRKGRGTRDQIANLRWIIEKSYEYGNALYMRFIDYNEAFDCVNHSQVWNTLRRMGIPEHITILIKNLY